jgi:hypothetical protein
MTPLRDGEEMISKCTPHLIAGQLGSPRRSSNLQRILASLGGSCPRGHVHRRNHRLQHVGDAAIVEVLERKGLSTKRDLYDIITEFRRKNPRVKIPRRLFLNRTSSLKPRIRSSTTSWSY